MTHVPLDVKSFQVTFEQLFPQLNSMITVWSMIKERIIESGPKLNFSVLNDFKMSSAHVVILSYSMSDDSVSYT